jgi:hypothetical protein
MIFVALILVDCGQFEAPAGFPDPNPSLPAAAKISEASRTGNVAANAGGFGIHGISDAA